MQIADFQQVLRSPTAAYEEGLNFFEGKGMLHETLRQLAEDLEKNGIAYNVIGAIALKRRSLRTLTHVKSEPPSGFARREPGVDTKHGHNLSF
jgi:hypothetical protein